MSPELWARQLGAVQTSDSGEIGAWLDAALASHPCAVADALNNRRKSRAARIFLAGQVMKLSKGKANPKIVEKMLEEALARRAETSE